MNLRCFISNILYNQNIIYFVYQRDRFQNEPHQSQAGGEGINLPQDFSSKRILIGSLRENWKVKWKGDN